jgi:hypothetical protein
VLSISLSTDNTQHDKSKKSKNQPHIIVCNRGQFEKAIEHVKKSIAILEARVKHELSRLSIPSSSSSSSSSSTPRPVLLPSSDEELLPSSELGYIYLS